jgi:hypothetical protein
LALASGSRPSVTTPEMVVCAAKLQTANSIKTICAMRCFMPQRYGKKLKPPNIRDRQLKTLMEN